VNPGQGDAVLLVGGREFRGPSTIVRAIGKTTAAGPSGRHLIVYDLEIEKDRLGPAVDAIQPLTAASHRCELTQPLSPTTWVNPPEQQ
jgi:hypothetical protein